MAVPTSIRWQDGAGGGTPLTAAQLNAQQDWIDARATEAEAAAVDAQNSAQDAAAPTDPAVASFVDQPTSATRAALDGRYARVGTMFDVTRYGAVGDNATDNLGAFQAAYNAAVAAGGGTIYIPAGKYRLSGTWDIWRANSPRVDIVIRGESQWTTFVLANFYGAGASLIQAVDPAGATRCSPTSLYHLQLGTVDRNGANPVLLNVLGIGESRIESVRFGACNNTVMRLSSLQNVRIRDVVSFYGGKSFGYRATSGMTFSTTAGQVAMTSSASIFTAADVGRDFNLYGSSTRAKYRISNYTSPTQVSISGNTPTVTITNGTGRFEPARITTTAGSNVATANADCFTSSDVGRVIYIQSARSGPWGPAMLRATITAVNSAAQVTLDKPAGLDATRTEFAVPVVDLYGGDGAGTVAADSNDVKVELLHVENYAGVGLAVQGSIFMHLNDLKIHGEVDPTDTFASSGHMWLDDFAGVVSGELDGMSTGQARIHLCNMNDLATFDWIATRRIVNETVFEVDTMTDPGGMAEVRSFNVYSATTGADPYAMVTDANTPRRVWFVGTVNMLGDSEPPRSYQGQGTYFEPGGGLVLTATNGTRYRVTVSTAGALTVTAI